MRPPARATSSSPRPAPAPILNPCLPRCVHARALPHADAPARAATAREGIPFGRRKVNNAIKAGAPINVTDADRLCCTPHVAPAGRRACRLLPWSLASGTSVGRSPPWGNGIGGGGASGPAWTGQPYGVTPCVTSDSRTEHERTRRTPRTSARARGRARAVDRATKRRILKLGSASGGADVRCGAVRSMWSHVA